MPSELTKKEVEDIFEKKIKSKIAQDAIEEYLKKTYGTKEFDRAIRKIVANCLEDLFRSLWQYKNSYIGDVLR